ncbi:MAG: hypothetical protein ABSD44_14325 [Terracidiphilus sp.]
MKMVAIVALCVLAVGAAIGIYWFRHASVLERKYVVGLRADEFQHGGIHVVRISGLCGHSSMSVYDVKAQRLDSSINVLVYINLVLPGTKGYINYDVPIPDGVNEVRFGKEKVVIWRRNTVGLPLPGKK